MSLVNGVVTEVGTQGNDVVTVDQSGGTLTVTENGTPYAFTTTGISQITCNTGYGDDSIVVGQEVTIPCSLGGGNGNDTIIGGGGNDTLAGGLGNDSLDGGGGVNTATYVNRFNPLFITNDGLPDSGDAFYGEADIINPDIQNLTGGNGADSIVSVTANSSVNGGGGNDTLSGLAGNDTFGSLTASMFVTVDFSWENDPTTTASITPWGGNGFGSATISNASNQVVVSDVLARGALTCGGRRRATTRWATPATSTPTSSRAGRGTTGSRAAPGADTLLGGPGNDTIIGMQGADSINGGEGNNVLYGYSNLNGDHNIDSGNTIIAGSGNDTIYTGNMGGDSVSAGAGNDYIISQNYKSDTVDGVSGIDTVAGDFSDVITNVKYKVLS